MFQGNFIFQATNSLAILRFMQLCNSGGYFTSNIARCNQAPIFTWNVL